MRQDQRLFERFNVDLPVQVKLGDPSQKHHAVIHNISGNGVRISTDQGLSLFDKLSLLVPLPDSEEPMGIDCHVKWADQGDILSWNAGLEFADIDLLRVGRLLDRCR